jgi:hypothetical protein
MEGNMATFENEEELRKRLKKNLDVILNDLKVKDLIRTEDLGREFNFSEGKYYFDRMINLFEDFSKIDLGLVPFNKLEEFTQYSSAVISHFGRVLNFQISKFGENVKQERENILKFFRTNYDKYHNDIIPYFSYSTIKSFDLEKRVEETNKTLNKLINESKSSIDEQRKILEESKSILETIRQTASKVGVSEYASIFRDEAINNEEQAKNWFKGMIVVSIFTLGVAIFSIFFLLGEKIRTLGTPQIIQLSIGKIIILSILYYILVLCVRNYNAQRHNFIVNKHRQNSLNTFETFVKSAGKDIDTKNAILLETTRSIFLAQHSGYIKQDIDTESPNKFIEIIRNIGGNIQK